MIDGGLERNTLKKGRLTPWCYQLLLIGSSRCIVQKRRLSISRQPHILCYSPICF